MQFPRQHNLRLALGSDVVDRLRYRFAPDCNPNSAPPVDRSAGSGFPELPGDSSRRVSIGQTSETFLGRVTPSPPRTNAKRSSPGSAVEQVKQRQQMIQFSIVAENAARCAQIRRLGSAVMEFA